MNLKEFDFTDIKSINYGIDKSLLEEAESRKDTLIEYRNIFSSLFFIGGQVVFKKNINEEYRKNVWAYCRQLMQSWMPKHEHKEIVCALLMSEILEPKLKDEN